MKKDPLKKNVRFLMDIFTGVHELSIGACTSLERNALMATICEASFEALNPLTQARFLEKMEERARKKTEDYAIGGTD